MKKVVCLILFSLIFSLPSYSITYEQLMTVKDPAYRFGTTGEVENKLDINPTINDTRAQNRR